MNTWAYFVLSSSIFILKKQYPTDFSYKEQCVTAVLTLKCVVEILKLTSRSIPNLLHNVKCLNKSKIEGRMFQLWLYLKPTGLCELPNLPKYQNRQVFCHRIFLCFDNSFLNIHLLAQSYYILKELVSQISCKIVKPICTASHKV